LISFFSLTRPEPQPSLKGKSKKQLKREKRKLRRQEAKAKKSKHAIENKNTAAEQKSEPCELKIDVKNELEMNLPDIELGQQNDRYNQVEMKLPDEECEELRQKKDKNSELENNIILDGKLSIVV